MPVRPVKAPAPKAETKPKHPAADTNSEAWTKLRDLVHQDFATDPEAAVARCLAARAEGVPWAALDAITRDPACGGLNGQVWKAWQARPEHKRQSPALVAARAAAVSASYAARKARIPLLADHTSGRGRRTAVLKQDNLAAVRADVWNDVTHKGQPHPLLVVRIWSHGLYGWAPVGFDLTDLSLLAGSMATTSDEALTRFTDDLTRRGYTVGS